MIIEDPFNCVRNIRMYLLCSIIVVELVAVVVVVVVVSRSRCEMGDLCNARPGWLVITGSEGRRTRTRSTRGEAGE